MTPVRHVLVLTLAGALAAGRLGGLLPCSEKDVARWPWCGTWIYPVGRDDDFQARPAGGSGYELLRGFGGTGHREAHQGVDLGCGHTGGWVRAAAHGIVVQSVSHDSTTAYGCRVVVAHRLAEGGIVYSVYAHLLPGSARVRAGQRVAAGDRIARVGESGNATAPHLHFEIRTADDLGERWEKARAVDPVSFVAAHLGSAGDPGRSFALGRWAEQSALVPPEVDPARALDRSRWRTMLECATRSSTTRGATSETLGVALDPLPAPRPAAGHTNAGRRDPQGPAVALDPSPAADLVTWPELEHDLARLGAAGLRIPPPAAATRPHADPGDRRGEPPRVMDAVARLAVLASPPARAAGHGPKHGARKHAAPHASGTSAAGPRAGGTRRDSSGVAHGSGGSAP